MFHIGHIELFVADPIASREFYVTTLGFELVAVQDEQFVWIKSGAMEILLRPGANNNPVATYNATSGGIALYTDDVENTAEILRKRGLEFRGTDGWEYCLTFTDPDGHWFQLVNPDHG